MDKPRKLQEIFDAVIDHGIYPGRHQYMCHALAEAARTEVITQDERDKAVAHIQAYMDTCRTDWSVLSNILKRLKRNRKHRERRNIEIVRILCLPVYKNWAKRPNLKSYSEY